MSGTEGGSGSGFSKVTKFIVGVTGVLVVVPALINAGVDVYRRILNIPGSEGERTNIALYQKHFKQKPLFAADVPVVTDLGEVKMSFEVYDGGDILVVYGKRSQWFPLPFNQHASTFQLIGSANAQYPAAADQGEMYRQYQTYQGGSITRERFFEDGSVQSYAIDPRTGNWSEPRLGTSDGPPEGSTGSINRYQFPQIDIRSQSGGAGR